MIKRLKVVRAEEFYPYRNQAIELYLLENCKKDEMILYLWANDKTVVIGKNQNAFTECNNSALTADGGYLARRISGGGAVYHDKGNLNFTFITAKENYDIANQFKIMIEAMRSLGFNAELNGRNDAVINGKKFSGNAFYKSAENCLHHGTILIDSDYAAISKYLNVGRIKLDSKGVKSVVSRVGNLSDYDKDVDANKVASALIGSLKANYPNAKFVQIKESELPDNQIKKLTERFSDKEFIYGDDVHYETKFEYRFSWGIADIRLELNGNLIEKAKIYSDSLDTDGVELKEKLLTGADLTKPADPRIMDIIEAMGALKNEI